MQASIQNPREAETPRATPRAGAATPSASHTFAAPVAPAANPSGATGAIATGAFQWSEPRGDTYGAAQGSSLGAADVQGRATYQPGYQPSYRPDGYNGALGYGPQAPQPMPGIGRATALVPGAMPFATPDPNVWLIALPTTGGSYRSLEGAGRSGAIRVSRPYGHLRAIRPVFPTGDLGAPLHRGGFSGLLTEIGVVSGSLVASVSGPLTVSAAGASDQPRRGRATGAGVARKATGGLGSGALGKRLPAERPTPQVIMAVEIESDAGLFRVERPDSVMGNDDLAWALAHMEAGEPDGVVPLPRRYLALLLTLLPTPEDPEHPEADRNWGWAHRLRGPWERGPLHPRGKLGRLIAVESGRQRAGTAPRLLRDAGRR